MTSGDFYGDPWLVQYVAHDGQARKLYEADIELLQQVGEGLAVTDSRFPGYLYIAGRRMPRSTWTRFKTLIDLGAVEPASTRDGCKAGISFELTDYRLADVIPPMLRRLAHDKPASTS
jgi:hypothetical protein